MIFLHTKILFWYITLIFTIAIMDAVLQTRFFSWLYVVIAKNLTLTVIVALVIKDQKIPSSEKLNLVLWCSTFSGLDFFGVVKGWDKFYVTNGKYSVPVFHLLWVLLFLPYLSTTMSLQVGVKRKHAKGAGYYLQCFAYGLPLWLPACYVLILYAKKFSYIFFVITFLSLLLIATGTIWPPEYDQNRRPAKKAKKKHS